MTATAYAAAGVDIEAGNEAVRRIQAHVDRTARPEVVGGLGGFAAGFAFDTTKYRNPVLVSATDGVGTKLLVAAEADRWESVGVDLVAMCVNDIAAMGAEPLFFLDYIATGKVEPAAIERIVSGVADGCLQAGCALVGGETAEMPGMYRAGHADMAGFAVGVVERTEVLGPNRVQEGDVLIGLASSGLHSNGYSLVRHALLDGAGMSIDAHVDELGCTLSDELLRPTRIYAKSVGALAHVHRVNAAAHITGGGLVENVPRALPDNLMAGIDLDSWCPPRIFELLARATKASTEELFTTFNMGIGMVLVVDAGDVTGICRSAAALGEQAYVIGRVHERPDGAPAVLLHGGAE